MPLPTTTTTTTIQGLRCLSKETFTYHVSLGVAEGDAIEALGVDVVQGAVARELRLRPQPDVVRRAQLHVGARDVAGVGATAAGAQAPA